MKTTNPSLFQENSKITNLTRVEFKKNKNSVKLNHVSHMQLILKMSRCQNGGSLDLEEDFEMVPIRHKTTWS